MTARPLIAALCVLLLAGCGGAKDEADRRTASGEVLEGSISDDMLPLARVTSQPPRLKAQPSGTGEEDAELSDGAGEPGDAPPIAGDGSDEN